MRVAGRTIGFWLPGRDRNLRAFAFVVRLPEKGGKPRWCLPTTTPRAPTWTKAGIAEQKKGPLFRSLGRHRQLTLVTDMLRRSNVRPSAAGLLSSTCCHILRAWPVCQDDRDPTTKSWPFRRNYEAVFTSVLSSTIFPVATKLQNVLA